MSPTPSSSQTSPTKKSFSLKFLHLLLPYLLGVIWTALHPILSVVTGELKCRGSYIDESGLDANRLHIVDSYEYSSLIAYTTSSKEEGGGDGEGLCAALEKSSENEELSSVDCYTHHHYHHHHPISTSDRSKTTLPSFDIVKIIPNSSPVNPVESIVLVINNPPPHSDEKWSENSFHSSILKLIQRLGNSKKCPWLAKTVLIISPHSTATTDDDGNKLEGVVESFLAAYNGGGDKSTSTTTTKLLPLDYASTMIRTLLVYNILQHYTTSSSSSNMQPTIQILPQGNHGALPNLDLIFAINSIYKQHFFGYGRRRNGVGGGGIVHHVYGSYLEEIKRNVEEFFGWISLREYNREYVEDLLGMLGFGFHLAVGPYPPHAPALNHGIDSLTITSTFPSTATSQNQEYGPRFVQNMERTIRILSNLHERLHHSITQYLLPNPSKFVSHGEYIYPTILILISLVVRAGTLALKDIWRFHFRLGCGVVLGSILMGVGTMAVFALSLSSSLEMADHAVYSMIYLSVLGYIGYSVLSTRIQTQVLLSSSSSSSSFTTKKTTTTMTTNEEQNEWKRAKQSIQFLACLMAIYLHVPIALSHVSLAYPSALLWCPLLSFPSYGSTKLEQHGEGRSVLQTVMMGVKTILAVLVLFALWPPVFLVPKVFGVYSMYVLMVYTPLHLFLATLWLF